MSNIAVAIVVAIIVGVTQVTPIPAKPDSTLADDPVYLEALVRRKPEADANDSLRNGEKSFLGVVGYSIAIPGIPEKLAECPAVYEQVKVIRGTTDYVKGGERHRELIILARDYATRYNMVISKSRRPELSRVCTTL